MNPPPRVGLPRGWPTTPSCVISLLIPPWSLIYCRFPYITDPRLQVKSVYYRCDNVETIIQLQWKADLFMLPTHQHIRVTWNNNEDDDNNNNNNHCLILKKDIGCSCCKVHIHCTPDRNRGDRTVSLHIASTHIPRLFVGCGSKTGDVSREYVSRDRFSHKANNKIWMFHKIRFDEGKNIFIL